MTAFGEFRRDEDFSISRKEANQWFLKAAQQDLPEAQYEIGKILFYGFGCDLNTQKAMRWLTLSAKANYPFAQNFLGTVLLEGGQEYSDNEKAVFWLKQAAENKYVPSMARLAWLMAVHPHVRYRDGKQALKFAKAVQKPHEKDPIVLETLAAAHAELGDFKKAVKWQREAIAKARHYDWDLALLNERLQYYKAQKPWRGL